MGFQETFKALSDSVRRDILQYLKEGKMSAGEISEKFDMTGATISYHLSVLKKAELVREERVKNFIYYELNTSVFEEIMIWFSHLGGKTSEKISNEDVVHFDEGEENGK
ncbi:MAG: winged helix-turn-helix transcriptional regulator [Treponema sp.]|nr:winged helix-turn-helix transcriptional regulator [Treponema sp.]